MKNKKNKGMSVRPNKYLSQAVYGCGDKDKQDKVGIIHNIPQQPFDTLFELHRMKMTIVEEKSITSQSVVDYINGFPLSLGYIARTMSEKEKVEFDANEANQSTKNWEWK